MADSWLRWVRQVQALAQTGLTYATDPYDVERYEQLRALAAEMLATHTDVGVAPEYVRDLFALEAGHATPKVDVRGAVFRDGALLLVRERSDGLWTLPGGWADVGEAPGDAVTREVYEESCFRTRPVKLAMLYDRDKHGHPPLAYHVYKLFFLCQIEDSPPSTMLEGHGVAFAETDEVGFFRADAIPPLSLTRVTPAEIERLFAHHSNPDWPTEFD